MRIGHIDFPKEVLDALRNGELVIFAGAGVSRDKPTCLPDFKALKDKIIERTSHEQKVDEPLDRFLGRVEREGVRVHEIVKEVFSKKDSGPNHYHNSIVKLFNDGKDLRIITTNYDPHFTTALEDSNMYPEIYKAPALPIGQRFRGLVYLHGCADSPANRLIITDSDFGRAYMTEGWARRFLLGVYEKFTVLFVGYSYDDLVLSYLTRGLSSNDKRLYALAPDDKPVDNWRFLDITPIIYKVEEENNEHLALKESLERLVNFVCMDYLEHDERIRKLLNGPPPLIVDTEEDDYLLDSVQDPVRIKSFIRYANDLEWFKWAEERGVLADLFSTSSKSKTREQSSTTYVLAEWFASKLIINYPDEALGVFARQGNRMSRELWQTIGFIFHREAEFNNDTLVKWVPLLIQHYPPGEDVKSLEFLFGKCVDSQYWSLALLLFQFLTRPQASFKKTYANESNPFLGPGCSIKLLGSYFWLNNAWESIFLPNISFVADRIVRIASQQIAIAHDLGACLQISSDYLSLGRSAIEPNEQDEHPEAFYVLIDVCRDSLEWLLKNEPECAKSLIEEWLRSSFPILKRIALHGVIEDESRSPDDKLLFVTEDIPLDSHLLQHELFRLLEKAYPDSTPEVRKELIDKAAKLTKSKIEYDNEQNLNNILSYKHDYFELMAWLDKATNGTCQLVSAELEKIKKEHPEFQPEDHPDFLIWAGEAKWGSESPKSASELRDLSLSDGIDILLTFKGDEFFEPSREGLLDQFAIAIKESPDWGISIMNQLAKSKDEIPDDLWKRILWAWPDANLNESQWEHLLIFLKNNKDLHCYDRSIAQILQKGIKKDENGIPSALLETAEAIASEVWNIASTKDEITDVPINEDWLNDSINHTGGILAEFYLHDLSKRRKKEESYNKGIPSELLGNFNFIVDDNNNAATMGKILFASQLHFLFIADPEWTIKNMIPLFDWNNNDLQASQVWQGFLFWGRWFDDLLQHLLPFYKQCFKKLDSALSVSRDRFTNHIAGICMLSTLEEPRGVWLNEFLETVSNESRISFANSVGHVLSNMEDEKVTEIWHDWLSGYWDNRLAGKPGLSPEEYAAMIGWVPYLKSAFLNVVEKLVRYEKDVPIDDMIFHHLVDQDMPSNFQRETSRLLLYIAKYTKTPLYWDLGLKKTCEVLTDFYISNPEEKSTDFKNALNELVDKGYTAAIEYLRQLKDADSVDEEAKEEKDDDEGE